MPRRVSVCGSLVSVVMVAALAWGCGRVDYDPVGPSRDGSVLDGALFDGALLDGSSRDGAPGERTEVRCPAGEVCELTCPTGSGCSFVCEAGSSCTASCVGDCEITCDGTTCRLECRSGSSSCSGGGCFQSCPPASS